MFIWSKYFCSLWKMCRIFCFSILTRITVWIPRNTFTDFWKMGHNKRTIWTSCFTYLSCMLFLNNFCFNSNELLYFYLKHLFFFPPFITDVVCCWKLFQFAKRAWDCHKIPPESCSSRWKFCICLHSFRSWVCYDWRNGQGYDLLPECY